MDRIAIPVGLILAAAIAGAAFLAPSLMPGRTSEQRAADESAALATRQLYRYANNLADVNRAADLEGAWKDKLADLVVRAGPDAAEKTAFELLSEEFSSLADALRRSDGERAARGVTASALRPPEIDAGGVQTSLKAVSEWITRNEKLLQDAEKSARAAASAGRETPGGPHALGAVNLIRASERLENALRLRREVAAVRGDILAAAAEWKLATNAEAAQKSLDPAAAVQSLTQELEKLRQQKIEADAELERLRAQVAEREQQLKTVRSELDRGRKALLDLQKAGFQAGNDASFEAFRSQYRSISDNLALLQQQEQQWQSGGRSGATFAQEDVETGAIEGGESVAGLSEIQRRLDVVSSVSTQLEAGIGALQSRIQNTQAQGASSAAQAQRYAEAAAAAKTRIESLLARVDSLITAARAEEDAATTAAQAAAGAFADATRSFEQWAARAGQAASELDSAGNNARLKMIRGDGNAKLLPVSADGVARLTEARVAALRVQSTEAHLKLLDDIQVLIGGGAVKNREAIEGEIKAAREAGSAAAEAASKLFADEVARGSGNAVWIGQGLLGATHYVWAQIDGARADAHIKDALAALGTALDQRENSPYTEELVGLRNMLGGKPKEAPTAPAAGDGAAAENPG